MKRSIACVLVPLAAVALLVAAGCNNKKDEPQLGTSTKRAKVSQNKQTKQSKQARNAKNKQQQQPEYAQQSQQQRQPTAPQPKPYKAFGEQMRLTDADAVPVEDVLADPSVYQGRYVRLVGNVKKVC